MDNYIQFESATRRDDGPIIILTVRGTWFDMGRQYGALLKNELRDIYENFMVPEFNRKPATKEKATRRSNSIYECYSRNMKLFFDGICQGSGMSLEAVKYVNAVEYSINFSGCSTMVAWDEWTEDGLIFGRNYDYMEEYRSIARDIVLTVFCPSDGSQKIATIGYAGEIYVVNAINESGIMAVLNNGTSSGGTDILEDRYYSPVRLFNMMFEATDMDYVRRFFRAVNSNGSHIIIVSDGKTSESFEWDKRGMHESPKVEDSLYCATNYYLSPKWDYATPTDKESWDSIIRRNNMIARAEENKGYINADWMMKTMSTLIEDGGPMFPNYSLYELVWEPEKKVLWVRVIGKCEWKCIDLTEIFKDSVR